jgi:hypothetical protein
VLLGSTAGFCKGLDFAESKKSNKTEIIGTVLAVFSLILMLASLGGVIAFAIKLFVFLFVWDCLI